MSEEQGKFTAAAVPRTIWRMDKDGFAYAQMEEGLLFLGGRDQVNLYASAYANTYASAYSQASAQESAYEQEFTQEDADKIVKCLEDMRARGLL